MTPGARRAHSRGGWAWSKGWSCCRVTAPGASSPASGATGTTCSYAIERLGPQRALDRVLRFQQGAAQRTRQLLGEGLVGGVDDFPGDHFVRVHQSGDPGRLLGCVRLPNRQQALEERVDVRAEQVLLIHLMKSPRDRALGSK